MAVLSCCVKGVAFCTSVPVGTWTQRHNHAAVAPILCGRPPPVKPELLCCGVASELARNPEQPATGPARGGGAAASYAWISTGTPNGSIPDNCVMASLVMRMQPLLTSFPTLEGSPVP